MGATPGYNKIYKAELEKSHAIHCGRCPYHRRENIMGRVPRTDTHKDHRKSGDRVRG